MTSESSPAWRGDVQLGVAAWTHGRTLAALRDSAGAPLAALRDSAGALPQGPQGALAAFPEEGALAPVSKGSKKPRKPTSNPKPKADVDTDPEAVARTIILNALTGQARSRHELAEKLAKKMVPDEIATRLLDRFTEVGLIDDEAFARMWVEHRQPGKGLARRALAHELRRKGIADEVAREVLDEVDPADEEASARLLVRKKLRTLTRVDDTVATRRLVGMLARKGYAPGMAFAVVRSELAEARRDVAEDVPDFGS